MSVRSNRVLSLCVCLLLAGCPDPEQTVDEDAGGPPPDVCNSREDALSLPQCQLSLGQEVTDFIGSAGDQDWFSVQLPLGLTARSLLHLTAGYSAPNTPVSLTVNLLSEDGKSSLARVTDKHGQGSPKPIDILLPYAASGTRLVIQMADEALNPARPLFDDDSPYVLKVAIDEDPDVNEPNDQTPTALPLSNQAGVLVGAQTGYLATPNDVDRFKVTVPSGGRRILYLKVSGPKLSPPPPYVLSYTLVDPTGKPVSEGRLDNELSLPVLTTAQLVKTPGDYTVLVQGYRSTSNTNPIPGDLRLQYTVEARVLDDKDDNEPNQTSGTGTQVSLTQGSSQTLTGRLSYVADFDWFRVSLPASAAPTRLRYQLTPGTTPGRFPALAGLKDRQLRVLTVVDTGAGVPGSQSACRNDSQVCPKGYTNPNSDDRVMVDSFCNQDPPRCLRSTRDEHGRFANLRNFEGVLPVMPHAAAIDYLFLFEDERNDFADDIDYSIRFELLDDPDEAARFNGGVEQASVVSIPQVAPAGFPVPPAGALVLSGRISSGFGNPNSFDPNVGETIYGPEDYEAVPSDIDRYQVTLPALPDSDPDAGLPAPLDRTWELEWSVDKTPTGQPVHELELRLAMCNGNAPDGGVSCVRVPVGPFSYTDQRLTSWHNPGATRTPLQPVYEKTESSSSTKIQVRAYGCFCIEPRFMKGGTFSVEVAGVNRSRYQDVDYQVRMALTDYPQSFPVDGGASLSCSPPAPDGGPGPGCRFTQQ